MNDINQYAEIIRYFDNQINNIFEDMGLFIGANMEVKNTSLDLAVIKSELIDLIMNMDVEKSSTDFAFRFNFFGESCVQYCTIDHVRNLLLSVQKPKELTLEEKLTNAGFVKISITEFNRGNIKLLLSDQVNLFLTLDNFSGVMCLRCKLSDHDQIFKDISYLENRS